jgi:glutamate synthase domain-containing protein 3
MLGAEEWGIATAPLVTMGCIMMRKCHLNTCPVGIATQDPALRKKFDRPAGARGQLLLLIAEGLREIMAELGFRTRSTKWSAASTCSKRARRSTIGRPAGSTSRNAAQAGRAAAHQDVLRRAQDHGMEKSLDMKTARAARQAAIEHGTGDVKLPIRNVNRTWARFSPAKSPSAIRPEGLAGRYDSASTSPAPRDRADGAFAVPGVTIRMEGDVNDYCGKGLSGGKIIVRRRAKHVQGEDNIIAGNVVLYGATSGEVYLNGIAGERFCVRNSGAKAVVEGVGDHGCEYMTGGLAVILGPTGRNFAAGMSGGIAYVLDRRRRCPTV